MPYILSQKSLTRLNGVNPLLIELLNISIKYSPVDFGIPEHGGRRSIDEQKQLFDSGVSKCDGTHTLSKHQSGDAFDILPFVNGKPNFDKTYYCVIAGVILTTATRCGMKLRWGGNWDMDSEIISDQHFQDLGHFELI